MWSHGQIHECFGRSKKKNNIVYSVVCVNLYSDLSSDKGTAWSNILGGVCWPLSGHCGNNITWSRPVLDSYCIYLLCTKYGWWEYQTYELLWAMSVNLKLSLDVSGSIMCCSDLLQIWIKELPFSSARSDQFPSCFCLILVWNSYLDVTFKVCFCYCG